MYKQNDLNKIIENHKTQESDCVKILYFARLKESLKVSSENLEFSPEIATIDQLKSFLSKRGGIWSEEFSGKTIVRAAINHNLAIESDKIQPNDEIAFFPPVTGG